MRTEQTEKGSKLPGSPWLSACSILGFQMLHKLKPSPILSPLPTPQRHDLDGKEWWEQRLPRHQTRGPCLWSCAASTKSPWRRRHPARHLPLHDCHHLGRPGLV